MTVTREEAIKTLKELWRETNDSWYEETYKMAIEALQAEQEDEPIFYDEDDYWNGRVLAHDKLINASWVINEIHKNVCDMCEQGIDIEDCNDCKTERIKRIIYSAPTVIERSGPLER